MKHYAKFKGGDEYDLIRPRSRRFVGHSAEWLAQTKDRYRRRERTQLKRMVEELVIEELGNDLPYWDAELEAAIAEHGRVVDEYTEAERCFERYGDEVDWDYYELRFVELRKRIDIAYREWYAAA